MQGGKFYGVRLKEQTVRWFRFSGEVEKKREKWASPPGLPRKRRDGLRRPWFQFRIATIGRNPRGQLTLALFVDGAFTAAFTVENEAEDHPEDELVLNVALGLVVKFRGQMAHYGSPVLKVSIRFVLRTGTRFSSEEAPAGAQRERSRIWHPCRKKAVCDKAPSETQRDALKRGVLSEVIGLDGAPQQAVLKRTVSRMFTDS
jgi:hypothetical protein